MATEQGQPGDPTFDRTTALALLLMDVVEALIKKGILSPEEFLLAANSTEKVLKEDQPAGAYLAGAIRDEVMEMVKEVRR